MKKKNPEHLSANDCEWKEGAGFGDEQEAVVFEGDYGVRVVLSKIPAGYHLPEHAHSTWASFTVIKGRKRIVLVEEGETFEATAGTTYFLHPGQRHIETAIEETVSAIVYDPSLEVSYSSPQM